MFLYRPDQLEPALAQALAALAPHYPLRPAAGKSPAGALITFEKTSDPGSEIRRDKNRAVIRYGRTNLALRALGSLSAGLPGPGAKTLREQTPFERFGIMLDCSRNAAMTVPHLQSWLRRLALLGYNQIMLYTEDTYQLPDEPYFGYLRGRYTPDELRTLDACARTLGIEMIGCIQTLAHLEQIFRWPAYKAIQDYESVLLVGEEKTYALVGKMLDTISASIASRRIHIGMDEAWAIGRGKYLDRHGAGTPEHGARREFDILNQHLARVVKMCEERGLAPLMWSDMFFAIGSPKHEYYDPATVIPPEVAAGIPKPVELVYWDYYHQNKEFYLDWITRHRALGKEPVMASGVWTWGELWYRRERTENTVGPCLAACRETGLKEVFFTMWGDDGAYCDFDSALAGLAWAAEQGLGEGDEQTLRRRFAAVCGADYAAAVLPSELSCQGVAAGVLWDDPLLGIFANDWFEPTGPTWDQLLKRWEPAARALKKLKARSTGAGDLAHAALLGEVLVRKVHFRRALLKAYRKRDRKGLAQAQKEARALARLLKALAVSFRRVCMRKNKPQGWETIQIRLAAQVVRHEETARRIAELLAGQADGLPELDEAPPRPRGCGTVGWHYLAAGTAIL